MPRKAAATASETAVQQDLAKPSVYGPDQTFGRPAAYKREYAKQAEKLCSLGATDSELADFFDVSTRTIYRWQIEHKDFCQSLKAGKQVTDERVQRSLYHRAIGYSHDAVKIFMPAGASAPVYAPYTEHVPPDTTAQIFWLKNRKPAEWREKVDFTVTVDPEIADRKAQLLGMLLSLNAAQSEGMELPPDVVDFLGALRGDAPPKVIEGRTLDKDQSNA